MNGSPRAGLSPPGPGRLAPHALAHWARKTPDAIAVQHAQGGAHTYAQLDRIARTWAAALARFGVQAGTHVATMLPNGGQAQFAMLGLGWLCAIEVPVNPVLTGALLRHVLASSDAEVLLVQRRELAAVLALDALPRLRGIVVLDADELPDVAMVSGCGLVGGADFLKGVQPAESLTGPVYRDIAAILYTSGTTGPSKGVLLPWAVMSQTWTCAPEDMLPTGGGIYCALPLLHNSGRSCFNHALARGARFVWRERFSGGDFWNDVRRHDCAAAALVGPMVQYLHAQPEQPGDADNPLRGIFCGPLIADIEAFKRRFGVRVTTGYGMTEIGIVLATGWDHGPWQNCGRVREDYPWPEVRVVTEHDEPLGPGQAGELVVRSTEPWSLSPGYYGMPDKTADAWRNGWFHTGDLFRHDEQGWFYLIDRLKDSIRRRGENISSFEVESVVARYPGVSECAAVAVPAEYGEDEIMVALQTADPAGFNYEAFFAWTERELPRFMRPRYAEALAELPRNATTQRVKKYELRSRGISSATRDRERRGGRAAA